MIRLRTRLNVFSHICARSLESVLECDWCDGGGVIDMQRRRRIRGTHVHTTGSVHGRLFAQMDKEATQHQ